MFKKIINYLKKLIKSRNEVNSNLLLFNRTIKTINEFDDIKVLEDDKVHSGWVFKKTPRSIIVIYSCNDHLKDAQFFYKDPNLGEIEGNNKKLLLNV